MEKYDILSNYSQFSKNFKLKINRKSSITILLMIVLFLEMAMPHKTFSANSNGINDKIGAKYQFKELALSSDVYTFNDKYVPEEIELQKLAKERNILREMEEKEKIKHKMTVLSTAYSSTVDQCDSDPFIAASGKRVFDGMLAANFLKFGTKVRIPEYFGDKVFTVEDRMNKRFNERVDIWMETRDEALKWGVKRIRVEILE
ncbi:MAG: 3D domain-containing protein [bacterium]